MTNNENHDEVIEETNENNKKNLLNSKRLNKMLTSGRLGSKD